MRRPTLEADPKRSGTHRSCYAPRFGPLVRAALCGASLLLAPFGCAPGGAASRSTTTVHAPTVDDTTTPPYEAQFTWFVRPLPTTGTVRVLLYIDAGSRDATPPQVATLAAFALAARLSRDPNLAAVHPQVTPDATAFSVECAAVDLEACARHLARLLQPTELSGQELAGAHRHLREQRARATTDATRGADAAALRALFGDAAAGLFPLGSAAQDDEATSTRVQSFLSAHYGSQRALLLAEGDVDGHALDELGETLRRAPRSSEERAARALPGQPAVAVDVAHAPGASVALRARDAEHALAIVHLLRDPAFVGESVGGGVDLAAFELRGASVVLLSMPHEALGVEPTDAARRLAVLALRASDAADAAPWRTEVGSERSGEHMLEPPPHGWPGAGSIQALGERWAAQQPGTASESAGVYHPDALGLGVSLDGGRADVLNAEDPDAATRSAARDALRVALTQALTHARPWQTQSALAPLFALPAAAAERAAAPDERLWDPVDATLPNGAQLRVSLSPTGENGVLVAFDGGPGEDGEPLHGRSALALTALAERCTRMLGALDGVRVATRLDADRVGLWFEDSGGGWARVVDVAARCSFDQSPDDADLQDAKRALLVALGPEGSDTRMRAWVAAALSPAQPGRVAPMGSGERLDAVRLGDVARALERLRAGRRARVVAFVRAHPRRVARRLAPRVAGLPTGEAFDPSRSRALGDSPHAVAWLGATPDHARVVVAFRDPLRRDGDAPPADLGRAHATAVAARLRSVGLDVVWVGGDGSAYGHWSAVAIETTLDALDGLPARIETALRADLPVALVLTELASAAPPSLAERAVAVLPPTASSAQSGSAGPRYIVARPQGAEAMRRRGGR